AVPEDASAEDRERRARAFGAALAPLVRFGTYIAGTDLGCGERDLWEILAGSPPPRSFAENSATATCSGRSAAIAAIAALGGSAEGATLAILGYGCVGA